MYGPIKSSEIDVKEGTTNHYEPEKLMVHLIINTLNVKAKATKLYQLENILERLDELKK